MCSTCVASPSSGMILRSSVVVVVQLFSIRPIVSIYLKRFHNREMRRFHEKLLECGHDFSPSGTAEIQNSLYSIFLHACLQYSEGDSAHSTLRSRGISCRTKLLSHPPPCLRTGERFTRLLSLRPTIIGLVCESQTPKKQL